MRSGIKEIALGVLSLVLGILSLVNSLACKVAVFLLYIGLAYAFFWSGFLNALFSKEAPSTEEFLKEVEEIKRKYGLSES